MFHQTYITMKLSLFPAFILSLWILLIGNCHTVFGQVQDNIAFQSDTKGWINFKPEVNLTASEILNNHFLSFSYGT